MVLILLLLFKIILNLSSKKHETLTENPKVQIYPNKIKNRIVFKIKTGYKLELLTPETDLKLSEAQISKIIQFGGFLGSLLSKLAGPLMKIAVPLAKNVLAPLGITAAASAIDAGIQKKNNMVLEIRP